MGGETTKKSPLWGGFCHAGRAPESMASGAEEEGEGGGGGGGLGDDREQQGGGGVYVIYGSIQLVDGGGTRSGGVQGGATGVGRRVAGGGPDSQG